MRKPVKYLANLAISIDQLANTLLGGDPDMTISARMGRAIRNGRCRLCRPVCWVLDKIDPGHCAKADKSERDEGRDQIARY